MFARFAGGTPPAKKSRSKNPIESTRAVTLEAENQWLTRQLAQMQAALDAMRKAHGFLGLLSERSSQSPPETGKSKAR